MLVALGVVQAASESFVRAPGTASALVPRAFGVRVYRALDRFAPAPFVDETLAADALSRGALNAAERYAVRLQVSARRDDLLGRIAKARGQSRLAEEYFFVAPDISRMQEAIAARARRDPAGAYDLERRFRERLKALRTHPDAVAESYWISGALADDLHHPHRSIRDYESAIALAPFNVKYLLGAANEAYTYGAYATATREYRRGLGVNPACGDCLAGLGLIALHDGHRSAAERYAARAQTAQPASGMLRLLRKRLAARP